MAYSYSDIAKACIESGKITGQYIRSCMRRTVAKFDWSLSKPAATDIVLICPIKLYDRIVSIKAKSGVKSEGATYRLALYSKMTGEPEKIAYLTNALAAKTIDIVLAEIWSENGAIDNGTTTEHGFDYETVYNVLAKMIPTGGSAGGGLQALKDGKYSDDTEFFLGLDPVVTESAATSLTLVIDTVDGVPSVQDGNKTILSRF